MYLTNKNNSNINIIKYYEIFFYLSQNIYVLTCETIVIDVASSNTFVNLGLNQISSLFYREIIAFGWLVNMLLYVSVYAIKWYLIDWLLFR